MYEFGPLEIVLDEILKSCCCNFNPCAVCELDRHSRLLRVMKFYSCLVDASEAVQASECAVIARKKIAGRVKFRLRRDGRVCGALFLHAREQPLDIFGIDVAGAKFWIGKNAAV